MKKNSLEQKKEFFKSLNPQLTYFSILNFFSDEYIAEIDPIYPYNSMLEKLNDWGAFNVEIFYSTIAIEYLMNNDTSLSDSLALAADLGYETRNLSSELLASLLASNKSREEFIDLRSQIEEFFNLTATN